MLITDEAAPGERRLCPHSLRARSMAIIIRRWSSWESKRAASMVSAQRKALAARLSRASALLLFSLDRPSPAASRYGSCVGCQKTMGAAWLAGSSVSGLLMAGIIWFHTISAAARGSDRPGMWYATATEVCRVRIVTTRGSACAGSVASITGTGMAGALSGPKLACTAASACGTSNSPATISTALSGR